MLSRSDATCQAVPQRKSKGNDGDPFGSVKRNDPIGAVVPEPNGGEEKGVDALGPAQVKSFTPDSNWTW